MKKIKGTNAVALVFTDNIDTKAIEQVQQMCNQDFAKEAKIRIMPDVHAGEGCTIGTTMTVTDKVVPNIVGVDIGCGMYTIKLNTTNLDMEKWDDAAHYIPSGFNVWNTVQEEFDLTQLNCYSELVDLERLSKSLGTLGGGNHFIEIDKSQNGDYYLVIHSGSRNLGKQVAMIYQKKAVELNRQLVLEKRAEKKARIQELKDSIGSPEILKVEMEKLDKEYSGIKIQKDLCYIHGDVLQQYLHDINICQQFAKRNRELMAEKLLEYVGVTGGESFTTIHNYINVNEMILRKGAISAHKGEKVLIPLNMRDGSILAVGKGNPEWNYSAPHGAGRIMGRMEAKRQLSMEEYKSAMNGIYTTSVNDGTLDESPMAYKPSQEIIDAIGDTVEVIEVIKPVYNFKANI